MALTIAVASVGTQRVLALIDHAGGISRLRALCITLAPAIDRALAHALAFTAIGALVGALCVEALVEAAASSHGGSKEAGRGDREFHLKT